MPERWQLNQVYRERAHLLAHLATVYPSHMQYDPVDFEWSVLYISAPTGQMTWHIGPADMDLFEHVRTDIYETWDGHTTDEKYERLDQAARMRAST